jgi:hypothetical protein
MAGVSEEAGIMVGATPEVIRRPYEKMDQMVIDKRSVERRLSGPNAQVTARPLRGGQKRPLDDHRTSSQTVGA